MCPTSRLSRFAFGFMAFLLWTAGWPAQAAPPPSTVVIQGSVVGSGGSPLVGTRNWRVRFYDAATAGSQLGGMLTGSTLVSSQGVFNIAVTPPIQAMQAPAAWYELALDTDTPPDGDATDDVFPDRVQLHSVPFAQFSAAFAGEAFVMTSPGPSATANAANLIAAYAKALTLTPHGSALAAANRAVVLVLPGIYDLGTSQLTLDTEFVDLVGVSSARENQLIFGLSNGASTGVLRQTANDVRIENMVVECRRSSGGLSFNDTTPSAYFPDSNKPLTTIRNCLFRATDEGNAHSMRTHIVYSGTYEACAGGTWSFGYGGTASGRFDRCTGLTAAFGSAGTASGTFTRCTAANDSFGGAGTASGTFTDCTGDSNCFGGGNGTAFGTFTNCTALSGFGDGAGGTSLGAKLYGCRMAGGTWPGTFTGRMENCRWESGIVLGAEARIYGSTFIGTVDLANTAAGLTQSRAEVISNDGSNAFGNTNALAMNIEDVDVN